MYVCTYIHSVPLIMCIQADLVGLQLWLPDLSNALWRGPHGRLLLRSPRPGCHKGCCCRRPVQPRDRQCAPALVTRTEYSVHHALDGVISCFPQLRACVRACECRAAASTRRNPEVTLLAGRACAGRVQLFQAALCVQSYPAGLARLRALTLSILSGSGIWYRQSRLPAFVVGGCYHLRPVGIAQQGTFVTQRWQ